MTGVLYIIPYLQQPCPITGGFVVYENINIYLKKKSSHCVPKMLPLLLQYETRGSLLGIILKLLFVQLKY